jgi:hypothetical protein
MLDKLQHIDRRIVYLLFFIVTAVPYVRPILLPMQIADYTKGTYGAIEALKPGDFVLMDVRFSPASVGEFGPPYNAILTHLFKKPGVRLAWFVTSLSGIIFADDGIRQAEATGRVYGKDIVQLGYLAGEETAIAAVSQDIFKAFPFDNRGGKTETMDVLKGIKNAKDFALVLNLSDGGLGPLGWVRQAHLPFGTKVISLLGQSMVPSAIPYWQAKQVVGLISGLQGGAEYEQLLQAPSRGMASMGAQTVGHVYLVLLVILANLGYLITRYSGSQKGGQNR